MGTYTTKPVCPRCKSVEVDQSHKRTLKCLRCEFMAAPAKFKGRYYSLTSAEFQPDSESVPKKNKRRQKGQRRMRYPGDDE